MGHEHGASSGFCTLTRLEPDLRREPLRGHPLAASGVEAGGADREPKVREADSRQRTRLRIDFRDKRGLARQNQAEKRRAASRRAAVLLARVSLGSKNH